LDAVPIFPKTAIRQASKVGFPSRRESENSFESYPLAPNEAQDLIDMVWLVAQSDQLCNQWQQRLATRPYPTAGHFRVGLDSGEKYEALGLWIGWAAPIEGWVQALRSVETFNSAARAADFVPAFRIEPGPKSREPTKFKILPRQSWVF
jgi:hypothetical protein